METRQSARLGTVSTSFASLLGDAQLLVRPLGRVGDARALEIFFKKSFETWNETNIFAGNYRQVPRLREQVPEHPPPHAEHGAVGAEVVVGAELGGEGVAGVAVGPAGTRILLKMGKHRVKTDDI